VVIRIQLGWQTLERFALWRVATLGWTETLVVNYMLRVSDNQSRHLVVLTLDESTVSRASADVIFDVIGASTPDELRASGRLAAGQIEDLKALQNMIFDRDSEGQFIRENIDFRANGTELDPDAAMSRAFQPSERDGMRYMRCDLMVIDKDSPFKA